MSLFDLTDIDTLKDIAEDRVDMFDIGLYEKLFYYYLNTGDMPYGIAKCRDGDPCEWIISKLKEDISFLSIN